MLNFSFPFHFLSRFQFMFFKSNDSFSVSNLRNEISLKFYLFFLKLSFKSTSSSNTNFLRNATDVLFHSFCIAEYLSKANLNRSEARLILSAVISDPIFSTISFVSCLNKAKGRPRKVIVQSGVKAQTNDVMAPFYRSFQNILKRFSRLF